MATYPDVQLADLHAACQGWPGSRAEKAALFALVLRVRIERAAAHLPRTVIAAKPDISMIERRLYLSIGEPGLSSEAQVRRMRVVAAALAAYVAICEVLHGRNPDPVPSPEDLDSWTLAVDALEEDLYPAPAAAPSLRQRPLLSLLRELESVATDVSGRRPPTAERTQSATQWAADERATLPITST
jgi:hypothetical protein